MNSICTLLFELCALLPTLSKCIMNRQAWELKMDVVYKAPNAYRQHRLRGSCKLVFVQGCRNDTRKLPLRDRKLNYNTAVVRHRIGVGHQEMLNALLVNVNLQQSLKLLIAYLSTKSPCRLIGNNFLFGNEFFKSIPLWPGREKRIRQIYLPCKFIRSPSRIQWLTFDFILLKALSFDSSQYNF